MKEQKFFKSCGLFFSNLGQALMLPTAALPIAGLMVGLGNENVLGHINPQVASFLFMAGLSLFENLPLIFALGVAVGFAKENHGAAALAALVGYLVFTSGLSVYNNALSASMMDFYGEVDKTRLLNTGVLGGIMMGTVAGFLYNRFKDITLPPVLAFFSGRRFIPIVTGLSALLLSAVFMLIWPPLQNGLNSFGGWIIRSGGVGLFFYGFFNRMLLPLGLHHVLNTMVWFQFGEFTTADGVQVYGDLWRFFAGDPTAGGFMAGYFPVMMFGLPAACLAMIIQAKPARRAATAGLLLSAAFTAFLTGITEPIEFSFMFLAFPLYVIHAILTGLSLVVMHLFHVLIGFGFSAGLIDYLVSFGLSTKPLLLFPIGAVYAVLYFVVFWFAIKFWNLKTPGREEVAIPTLADSLHKTSEKAQGFVTALGGKENIVTITACATRLRLEVKDSELINEPMLTALGSKGVIKKANSAAVQVIIGPAVDLLLDQIKEAMNNA